MFEQKFACSVWSVFPIHSLFILGPVFLFEPKFHFSLLFFVCTRGILTLIFCVFLKFFWSVYYRNGFPNSLTVRSSSRFLVSQWKIFELYVRACAAMFFFVVKMIVATIWRHNHFRSAFCSFVHATSIKVRAWRHFLLLLGWVFFCPFAWKIDLPHSQKWLPHSKIDFYFTFFHRDRVKWVCVDCCALFWLFLWLVDEGFIDAFFDVFFKICSHIFLTFSNQNSNWSSNFSCAKVVMRAKKRAV